MKATIGVYDSHEKALEAVLKLKTAGYPVKHISIMGLTETEDVDEDMHVIPHNPLKVGGLATGTILGTTLGILTGIGMFAIPGVGFLYGAGAIVGAAAGFDFGLIGGGLASIITTLGVHEEAAAEYQKELQEGKYLLVAQGSHDDVDKAQGILTEHATHSTLTKHAAPTNGSEESLINGMLKNLDKEFPLSGAETKL